MNIENYFSSKSNLQKTILQELNNAEKSIKVAVAWLTDPVLFNKLLQKQNTGLTVELIITKHEFNDNCINDFDKIIQNGGLFFELGDENGLMHNKFCIIDYKTIINGSFNWTKRANNSNQEVITIIRDDPRTVNDFVTAFDLLIQLTGFSKKKDAELDLGKALKYFRLFKAFISIGDTAQISPYLYEIKDMKPIKAIVDELLEGQYENALKLIDEFERNHTQIQSLSVFEKAYLISQIKILSYQIEALEIEKSEIDALVDQFNHRYILELNPLLIKIIALKKKIYEKLRKYGIDDDTYQNLDEEFRKANEEYEEEEKVKIPDLNDEDLGSIKDMYREAVKLCFPDSPNCIFEDKAKAAEVFSTLTDAYKSNNIEKVKIILFELRLKNTNIEFGKDLEIEHLRAKLETLKLKYHYIFKEVTNLKNTVEYVKTTQISNWDDYFNGQKILLEKEYEELNLKYVNHEQ